MKSGNIQLGLFLKLRKSTFHLKKEKQIYGAPMKPSEFNFSSKTQ